MTVIMGTPSSLTSPFATASLASFSAASDIASQTVSLVNL
jgi:hypothetical protein